METRRPTLRHGRSVLDYEVLPLDEFHVRLDAFRELMHSKGVEAAVVTGTPDEYSGLTYLTGYSPMNMPTTLIVGQGEKDLVLLVVVARNVPYVSTLTWLTDVRSYPSIGEGIDTVLKEWGNAGPIGLVGVRSLLSANLSKGVIERLNNYELLDLDDEYELVRRAKRPRELRMLSRARKVVEIGEGVARQRFISSLNPFGSILAAEGACRLAGARDVRALVFDQSDRSWRVPERREDTYSPSVTYYLGVDIGGYWAESLGSFPIRNADSSVAKRAVDAMLATVRPGVRLSELANSALSELDEDDKAVALAVGFGSTIGLGHERTITPDAGGSLESGEVLSLHCFAGQGGDPVGSSEMVRVTESGCVAVEVSI